jgi:asparagine synthase (glutamine-hydrolysing)
MSIQFGKYNFDGRPVAPNELDGVRPLLAPYGPDGEGSLCKNNLGILYRALHTTKESRNEVQPRALPSGVVITWDGRLDNREELAAELAIGASGEASDLEIVAAAYDAWGTGSFGRLIGDWALSIVDPSQCSLILARDFVGTRPLFYSVEKDHICWSSLLEPLVLHIGRSFELEEEYIAGWLAFFPEARLTPYRGVHAVPPGSFVRLAKEKKQISKYWDFNPAKQVRYHSDQEYEEHFRAVLSQAVRRRLRSTSPVIAELSGGMDSSSIVCMADDAIRGGFAEVPGLDTVSYYNDSEPNWNERLYFTKVEERRGRAGLHIDVSSQPVLPEWSGCNNFAATPVSVGRRGEAERLWKSSLTSGGYRVVLSGIGGDEVTGGVPTPIPELADALARARFRTLSSLLRSWCLATRRPWIHVLSETALRFCSFGNAAGSKYAPSWLRADFRERHGDALAGYPARLKLFSAPPSFQENMATLETLRREMSCTVQACDPPYEKRYPFLDRDLLEYVYAIPCSQLLRPGQRRSLMRRALAGIVPEEVLNRKRKGFVSRSLTMAFASQADALIGKSRRMLVSERGVVDAGAFSAMLQQLRQGKEVPLVGLIRLCELEQWLQRLQLAGGLTPKSIADGRSSTVSSSGRDTRRSLRAIGPKM